MRTLVIRNNTNEEKIWLRTFAPNEEYTVPSDNSLAVKYSVLDAMLIAVANGEASIGNGQVFFSTVNEQLNWLKNEDNNPKDADGSILIRPKAAKAGWVFSLFPVEFTTGKLNSIYAKKYDGSDRSYFTYKIYDSNDQEITEAQYEVNAVKTVIDFEPTFDYEIIGGQVQQKTLPTSDVRIWVVAVPDVPENYGGSKEMVGGVNMEFIDPTDKVSADGRVTKYMTYSATLHTNKLRLIVKHSAGVQHDLLLTLDMFRA